MFFALCLLLLGGALLLYAVLDECYRMIFTLTIDFVQTSGQNPRSPKKKGMRMSLVLLIMILFSFVYCCYDLGKKICKK